MAGIHTFDDFRTQLAEAILGMDELLKVFPSDPMLASIRRQLGFVEQWTRDGKRPSNEQIGKLSFGVLASRAVDEIESRLAQKLYRLATYLDEWPK